MRVSSFNDNEKVHIDAILSPKRKTVVIQGLGFVGSAMMAALAIATKKDGSPLYTVIGVELGHKENVWKLETVNNGHPPIDSTDSNMAQAFQQMKKQGNGLATTSHYAYQKADIVIVDIHLDIKKSKNDRIKDYTFSYDTYLESLKIIATNIAEKTLVLIETTVPPGTTEKIIAPLFKSCFQERGLSPDALTLAHSYERVMPGKNYLHSITNFYRVYSGITASSKKATRMFLESFINIKDYPLSELHSPTASEMAKVLENAYRATNIAFIQEWTDYAEAAQVNLFEVLVAIKKRPTHSNIMSPGFGVGGYCLTKDSLLADWAYTQLFDSKKHLEMSLEAVSINDAMSEHTFSRIKKHIPSLKNKYITVMGISYLNDVADTRFSPSEHFVNACEKEGATMHLHDPLVSYWKEKDCAVFTQFEDLKKLKHDILVLTVRHKVYVELCAKDIVDTCPGVTLVVDANNILNQDTYEALKQKNIRVLGIGKGHWKD